MSRSLCGILILTLTAPPLFAQEPAKTDPLDRSEVTEAAAAEPQGPAESICLMGAGDARRNGLPVEYFARVIWKESRFRPEEVGPQTRSGDRAEGIAQFMPRTA